jgi:hypothetical protein
MSFKKIAAQYEVMKALKSMTETLSKLGTSGGETEKRTLAVSVVAQNYIESSIKSFNDKIDREIPIAGPDGEPSEANAKARMTAGKVQNVEWKAVATVLNQGSTLGQKILNIDFYITIQAVNPEPFISFFKNGERGLTDSTPVKNVQTATAADYRVSEDVIRVYVNGIMVVGELTDDEFEKGLEDSIMGTASSVKKNVKNSHREYLENLAKKAYNEYETESYLNTISEDTPNQMKGEFFELGKSGTPYVIVENAQKKLKQLNLYFGKIDGILGNQTERALMNFQKRMGDLDVTGKLDQRTYNILMQINDATDSKQNKLKALQYVLKAKDLFVNENFSSSKSYLEAALALNPGGTTSNTIKKLLDIVNRKV